MATRTQYGAIVVNHSVSVLSFVRAYMCVCVCVCVCLCIWGDSCGFLSFPVPLLLQGGSDVSSNSSLIGISDILHDTQADATL